MTVWPQTAHAATRTALGSVIPGQDLRSAADFASFRAMRDYDLGTIYLYQRELGTAETALRLPGGCVLCGVSTEFSSATGSGELLPDKRREPEWRETQRCGCPHALNMRERALLHRWLLGRGSALPADLALMNASAGVRGWVQDNAHKPRILLGMPWDGSLAGSVDAVLSFDHLDRLADPKRQFALIHDALRPGGMFVFTTAFHYAQELSNLVDAQAGTFEIPDQHRHTLSWDLLDMLRQARFADAMATVFWSEELGYLGNMNFVFAARRA